MSALKGVLPLFLLLTCFCCIPASPLPVGASTQYLNLRCDDFGVTTYDGGKMFYFYDILESGDYKLDLALVGKIVDDNQTEIDYITDLLDKNVHLVNHGWDHSIEGIGGTPGIPEFGESASLASQKTRIQDWDTQIATLFDVSTVTLVPPGGTTYQETTLQACDESGYTFLVYSEDVHSIHYPNTNTIVQTEYLNAGRIVPRDYDAVFADVLYKDSMGMDLISLIMHPHPTDWGESYTQWFLDYVYANLTAATGRSWINLDDYATVFLNNYPDFQLSDWYGQSTTTTTTTPPGNGGGEETEEYVGLNVLTTETGADLTFYLVLGSLAAVVTTLFILRKRNV